MAVGAPSGETYLFVAGTRPEAVKLAPLILALKARDRTTILVATGQHRHLFDATLASFGLSAQSDLDVMRDGQSPADVVGTLLPLLVAEIVRCRPAVVIVQGDTATAFAGAIAANYAGAPLAHVEAGLRSGMRDPFPEEMHRRAIAQLADLHFAPTAAAALELRREGVAAGSIHITGNTGIDALDQMQARLAHSPALAAGLSERFAGIDRSRPLVLVTVHRRENHGIRLDAILAALVALSRDAEIVLPVHPHPIIAARVEAALRGRAGVHLLPPLDYPDFVWLMQRATLALTDSGGIQEEAPAIGLPVLVLRDVTERREGIESGNALLIGTDAAAIIAAVNGLLCNAGAMSRMAEPAMPYGAGDASRRIVDILTSEFGAMRLAAE